MNSRSKHKQKKSNLNNNNNNKDLDFKHEKNSLLMQIDNDYNKSNDKLDKISKQKKRKKSIIRVDLSQSEELSVKNNEKSVNENLKRSGNKMLGNKITNNSLEVKRIENDSKSTNFTDKSAKFDFNDLNELNENDDIIKIKRSLNLNEIIEKLPNEESTNDKVSKTNDVINTSNRKKSKKKLKDETSKKISMILSRKKDIKKEIENDYSKSKNEFTSQNTSYSLTLKYSGLTISKKLVLFAEHNSIKKCFEKFLEVLNFYILKNYPLKFKNMSKNTNVTDKNLQKMLFVAPHLFVFDNIPNEKEEFELYVNIHKEYKSRINNKNLSPIEILESINNINNGIKEVMTSNEINELITEFEHCLLIHMLDLHNKWAEENNIKYDPIKENSWCCNFLSAHSNIELPQFKFMKNESNKNTKEIMLNNISEYQSVKKQLIELNYKGLISSKKNNKFKNMDNISKDYFKSNSKNNNFEEKTKNNNEDINKECLSNKKTPNKVSQINNNTNNKTSSNKKDSENRVLFNDDDHIHYESKRKEFISKYKNLSLIEPKLADKVSF